jgi:hypothetical protein
MRGAGWGGGAFGDVGVVGRDVGMRAGRRRLDRGGRDGEADPLRMVVVIIRVVGGGRVMVVRGMEVTVPESGDGNDMKENEGQSREQTTVGRAGGPARRTLIKSGQRWQAGGKGHEKRST